MFGAMKQISLVHNWSRGWKEMDINKIATIVLAIGMTMWTGLTIIYPYFIFPN